MSLSFGYFDHINHVPGYHADDINYLFNGVIQDGVFRTGRDGDDKPIGTFESAIFTGTVNHTNFLVNNLYPTVYSGVTLSKDNDGVITADGELERQIPPILNGYKARIGSLTLEPGDYRVSDGGGYGRIQIYDGEDIHRIGGAKILAKSIESSNVFNIESSTTVYIFFDYNKKRFDNEQFYPMIQSAYDEWTTFIPCGTTETETIGDETVVKIGTGKALFNGIWIVNQDPITISFEDDDPPKLFYVAIEINKKLETRNATIKLVWGTDSELPALKDIPDNKYIIETNDKKIFQYALAKRVISGGADRLVPVEFDYVENLLDLPNLQIRNSLNITEEGYVLDARQGKTIADKAPFSFGIVNESYGYIKNGIFTTF